MPLTSPSTELFTSTAADKVGSCIENGSNGASGWDTSEEVVTVIPTHMEEGLHSDRLLDMERSTELERYCKKGAFGE